MNRSVTTTITKFLVGGGGSIHSGRGTIREIDQPQNEGSAWWGEVERSQPAVNKYTFGVFCAARDRSRDRSPALSAARCAHLNKTSVATLTINTAAVAPLSTYKTGTFLVLPSLPLWLAIAISSNLQLLHAPPILPKGA